jgi:hypothetical protein
MPRNIVELQVFIASPGDLNEERAALVHVIEELNTLWSSKYGVRLLPILWETRAHPAFGEDAQDVINEQLPQDYDLFIGLMWARFGTPTPRAGSGTAEEFDRALARYRANPSSVQLMIYFKDAQLPPSEIDPAQLLAVKQFRERVRAEGGVDWTFLSMDDFTANTRMHLTRVIQNWNQGSRPTTVAEGEVPNEAEVDHSAPANSPEEEAGFFDTLENATEIMSALADTQNRLTSYINELHANTNLRNAELTELTNSPSGGTAKTYTRISNHLAEDMERYVRRTRLEMNEFDRQLNDVLEATSTVASLAIDFGRESAAFQALPGLAAQVETFGTTLGENAVATRELRTIIIATPRTTTAYNRAKRATGEVLEELARIQEEASKTCGRVATGIKEIVSGGSSQGDSHAP